ncbi:MAG: hypothetical protein LQ344_002048 [Seirophora lacunosa]|nr:MAG: hypothetical protein LQ344_002048 [Seirophora lacunosa]
MAERSHQHHPFGQSHTRTRQASSSSSDQSSAPDDKSTLSIPRRRRPSPAQDKDQPPAAVASEPSRRRETKQTSSGPREKPSKGSSVNMTAPLDLPGEISYTPTTHRISKAKKGKKVHVCEFAGCNKVFTRAEHRKWDTPHPPQRSPLTVSRRHEANHNPEFAFQCQVEGCRKGFQRNDLLQRHLERQHELSTGNTRAPDPHRSMSETSSNPQSGSIIPSAMGQPPPVSAQSMSHGPGAMDINSIIEHHGPSHNSAHALSDLHTGIGPVPIGFRPEWTYGRMPSGDSPWSSDSCGSPVSDYLNPHLSYQPFHEGIQRPPSTFSDSSFHQGSITSPLSAGPSFPPHWVNSRSPISDLQTILHMEIFARYRARTATIDSLQASPQFTSLYESLIADQTRLQHSAASLQQALNGMSSSARLQAAWKAWIDVETRRRVLTAAFVLDTQHSHLVQRQASYTGLLGEDHLDLPFPCAADAWTCADLSTWRDLITSEQALSIGSVDRQSLPPLDSFQASLLYSYQLHRLQSSDQSIQRELSYHPTKSHTLATTLTFHALLLSNHVPLHALIMTASESWLFGTKITDEGVWQQGKGALRGWVSSHAAMKAVWHASQLLRLAFQAQKANQQPMEGIGSLHDLWCLYMAALVCWVFGYGTAAGMERQQKWEPENAEMLAAEYLDGMNVATWQEVGMVDGIVRRNTRGLSEWVRGKVAEVGMGGLLNGAEDVLFRLVAGESKMVEF